MKRQYDPEFIKALKREDVRIRKSFKQKIVIFAKDPYSTKLRNHTLREPYKGYRSITITADYRAIYQEKQEGGEKIAYFFFLGTHKELYKKSS